MNTSLGRENQNLVNENSEIKLITAPINENFKLSYFFNLSNNFEKTKNYLKIFGNYYVNYLFHLLGYQFKGKLNHPNLLHVTSQAWFLGVFDEIKKENIFNIDDFTTFSFLLNKIKQTIVEEKSFIENCKLLIGIYGLEEFFLKYDEILKIFLVNIQEIKNQLILENENISEKDFEEIIMRILRSAFNLSLNDFNSNESNKKSLDLLNYYLEFNTNNQNEFCSFERFKNYYFEKKNINEEALSDEEKTKSNFQLLSYFDFCKTNFEELIEEIDSFNHNAGSIIYLLKNLLSTRNLKAMYSRYFHLLSNKLDKELINRRLETVINFYKFLLISTVKDLTLNYLTTKFSNGRDWINSTIKRCEDHSLPLINIFKNYSFVQSKTINLIAEQRIFLIENVYQPISNVIVNIKNSMIILILNTLNFDNLTRENLKKFINEHLLNKLEKVKGIFLREDSIIKVEGESNKSDYMTISFSKKYFMLYPQLAKNTIEGIIKKIEELNLIETSEKALISARDKFFITKNYFLSTYKKISELRLADQNGKEDKASQLNETK